MTFGSAPRGAPRRIPANPPRRPCTPRAAPWLCPPCGTRPKSNKELSEDAYYSTTTLTKSTINNDEEFGPSLKHTRRRRRDGSSRKLKDAEKPTPQQGQEYYARCAVDALVRVLRDPSLASHALRRRKHLTQVVKALGHRCVPFLGALVPHLLDVARDGEPGLRKRVTAISITSINGKVPFEGLCTSNPRLGGRVLGAAPRTGRTSVRTGRVGQRPGAKRVLSRRGRCLCCWRRWRHLPRTCLRMRSRPLLAMKLG